MPMPRLKMHALRVAMAALIPPSVREVMAKPR
jgi:hypothetical protein